MSLSRFCSGSLPVGTAACLAMALSLGVLAPRLSAQMAPSQPPTKTAVAPPPKTPVGNGSFESASGPAGSVTSPYHTYLNFTTEFGWTYGHASGVAHRLSAFVNAADLSAIDGDRVAFLQGDTGEVSTTVTGLQAGAWRLVYKLANRVDQGFTNLPFLEVLLNGSRVALEAPRHTNFQPYTTRLITLAPGSSQITIQFKKTVDPLTGAVSPGTCFVDHVQLERVLLWEDSASWSPTGAPQSTDRVFIPLRRSIAFRGTHDVEWVHAKGEFLTMPENGALAADFVAVVGVGGRFEVGRRHAVFAQSFTLTLKGAPGGQSGFAMSGSKFLMSMDGGTLDVHGLAKKSWTRLIASTAVGGTPSYFDVIDATGWQVGDAVVLTGSTFNRAANAGTDAGYIDYAEKVQIKSITPIAGGQRIEIQSAPTVPMAVGTFAHVHLGGAAAQTALLNFSNPPAGVPTTLDQSAEAGNLTRNVRIEGDLASASYSPKTYGGHVMVMRCPYCVSGGIGRFSNIELTRMGQTGELGRYPIHFHMLKTQGAGSYVVNASVHETYNRAITVHGSDSTVIQDNVAYRNLGHAVFLEDGSEMYNVFERNLVVSTLRPAPGLETIPSDNSMMNFQDRSPSSYWITNPYNVFRDNVAAGTVGSGFWFIPPRTVLGLSAADSDLNSRVPPIHLPFMLDAQGQSCCSGNRAHSCRLGLDINDTVADAAHGDHPVNVANGVQQNTSWEPTRPVNPANNVADPTVPRYGTRETVRGFVAYGCDAGIYSSTGGDRVIYDQLVVADCDRGTDFASYHEVRNGVIVERGKVVTVPVGQDPNGGKSGIELYDGAGRYLNTVFRGWTGGGSTVAGRRGGAVVHPNTALDQVRYPDSEPGVPILAWPSVNATQGTVAGYSNVTVGQPDYMDPQNPRDPSKWGGTLLDESGELTGTPGFSVVGDAPILLTGHMNEHLWVNTISPQVLSHAFVSPHRFAHLRLVYAVPPVQTDAMSDLVIYRTSHPAGVFPTGGGLPPGYAGVGHDHLYNSRQYKQIPIIVGTNEPPPTDPPLPQTNGEYFVYTLDHHLASFLTAFSFLELTVDDALAGDVAIFRLPDFDTKSAAQITATNLKDASVLPEHTTVGPFMSSTQPALLFDASSGVNRVYLRVPVRTGANGSLPAGMRKFGAPFGGSTNLDDSRWRNETITITWQ